jgi:hypothetical protein
LLVEIDVLFRARVVKDPEGIGAEVHCSFCLLIDECVKLDAHWLWSFASLWLSFQL